MPQVQIRRQEQIQERIINRVVARSDLSDLGDTAGMKHMVVGFARELDAAYFDLFGITNLFSIDRAAGDDLDERAKDIQPGTLKRVLARRAIGTVVLSRAVAGPSTIVIPAGTVVKTADGQVFRTAIQTQITPTSAEQRAGHGIGRDSPLTSTVADAVGSDGNVAANTILKFGSKPPGVDEVINTTTFSQGRNEESDPSFRQRLKDFVNALARCTVEAIEFAVLGVEDSLGKAVSFSHVFEDPSTACFFIVYVDDGAGTARTTATQIAENVTLGLAGPPADSAVGGEEFLSLDFKPVDPLDAGQVLTLSSSVRGALTQGISSGGEYDFNPANSLIKFDPALVTAEVITASYTNLTLLLALVQRVVDGDPADRENFPGFRAAGTLGQVLSPVIIVQNVTVQLVLAEGVELADVLALVQTAILDYLNTLGISGDVIRNELIERIMAVDGVTDIVLTNPAANVAVLDNELIRSSVADLNIT